MNRDTHIRRVLIAGFGDVALRLCRLLQTGPAAGLTSVDALVRNSAGKDRALTAGVNSIEADLSCADSLTAINARYECVFHFAPPPLVGTDDTHTKHLLSRLAAVCVPRAIVYISTTGVYGDTGGAWVDESSVARPESTRAVRRVQAEEQVARWAADFSVRHVILRAPGIYASDRLPVDRLRAGLPTILDEEDSYSNHIHADDLAACALAAWTNSTAKGVFNVVDDSNLKMGAYFDLVADAMGMDRPPRVSRAEAHARVSAAMWSFMRESRRIRNERMKSELGYALKYPTVEVGLSALSDAARAAALATLDGTRRR